MPLVNTIYHISKKYDKHYCYPSQKKLQATLQWVYGMNRSISTINRWLRLVEDAGLIKRVRRIVPNNDGTFNFRSTMYFLKLKGLKKLNQMGYDVWEILKKYYDRTSKHFGDEKRLVEDDKNWAEIYKAIKEYPKKIKEKPDV